MSDARQVVAMRNELHTSLPAAVVHSVNWRAVADAAAGAIDRGWTGFELARWALAELAGTPADNPGAVIVATLRDLAHHNPPREQTPAPPRFDATSLHRARAGATRDLDAWVARIRSQLHTRPATRSPR